MSPWQRFGIFRFFSVLHKTRYPSLTLEDLDILCDWG